jgi:hypothetical protein
LIWNYHALVMELNDLARTAPDATVIDQLEDLAIQRGRETLRASLQQAVWRMKNVQSMTALVGVGSSDRWEAYWAQAA